MDVEIQSVTNEVKEKRSESLTDEEEEEAVLVFDFDDSYQKVNVPLPGHMRADVDAPEGSTSNRRLVSNGCAICLSLFGPEEKITWSSNPECPHIFHSDCVLHWYLTVGRKVQQRRIRRDPELSSDEVISKICDFPMDCPCCRRQNFCHDFAIMDAATSATHSSDTEDCQEDVERVSNEHT